MNGSVAGKQGFEPRSHDPESCVLPLDDFPAGRGILIDLGQMFNPLPGGRNKGIFSMILGISVGVSVCDRTPGANALTGF